MKCTDKLDAIYINGIFVNTEAIQMESFSYL